MIDRQSVYAALFKLKSAGEDVTSQLNVMASTKGVPRSVIVFLRERSPQFQFYRYLQKHQKALAKSILDFDTLSDVDKVIACSSFITRVYISVKNNNLSDKLIDELRVDEVTKALSKAVSQNDFRKMNEVMGSHSESLRLFYVTNPKEE